MNHPEAHTLELYVLNAESVALWRETIEGHLRDCAGCRALVNEMSEFYDQLDQELRKPAPDSVAGAGSALAKRNAELTIWQERMAVGPRGGWLSPGRKLRYYIRKYPFAAAGTTFAFTALAGIGLLMGYRELTKDVDPAYAELNKVSGFFEVYNRGNELLWRRLAVDIDTALNDQNRSGVPKYIVFDFDGDGRTEVLTTLQLAGEPDVPAEGLHVFDGKGEFRDITFSRKISWLGTPYELPVSIQAGNLVGVDSSDPDHPEILVSAKNDRSPNVILRMNGEGEILGEYWHHGQFRMLLLHDLDDDGQPELFLCGSNDVHDNAGPAEPVVIVLDPRKIEGRTESQVSRGYGYAKSNAELYYVRLPLTDFNIAMRSSAGVDMVRLEPDRILAYWRCGSTEREIYGLDFVFSRTFEPLRVISTTQIKERFDREYRRKTIPSRLDDAYLLKLKSEIRFWDGSDWREEPVKVGGAGEAVSSTEQSGSR